MSGQWKDEGTWPKQVDFSKKGQNVSFQNLDSVKLNTKLCLRLGLAIFT